MPGSSKARNPRGFEVEFFEETHKYLTIINGREIQYVSGTGFLSKYFPEFDPTGAIVARCAKKEGISVEEMKERWAMKGKESCRLGTRMHEICEDIELNRPIRNTPENDIEKNRFDNAIKIARKLVDSTDILGVEKIVFDEQLKIAGTIDLLAKSRKNGNILILDWKSNKEIEVENKYNKFCLEPISHIPDTSFYHYALQLSLYQYLLKFGKYFPVNSTFQRAIIHVTPEKFQIYQLPDLTNEIKDLIIDNQLHIINEVNNICKN